MIYVLNAMFVLCTEVVLVFTYVCPFTDDLKSLNKDNKDRSENLEKWRLWLIPAPLSHGSWESTEIRWSVARIKCYFKLY